MNFKPHKYENIGFNESDIVSDCQIPIIFKPELTKDNKSIRVLSLFSGCGGMDLGMEGQFIAHRKSFPSNSPYIERKINNDWIMLKKTSL